MQLRIWAYTGLRAATSGYFSVKLAVKAALALLGGTPAAASSNSFQREHFAFLRSKQIQNFLKAQISDLGLENQHGISSHRRRRIALPLRSGLKAVMQSQNSRRKFIALVLARR